MNQQAFLIFKFWILLLIQICQNQLLYNPNPTSYRNQTWMSSLDYGLPIRQMSIIGTHNSVVTQACFFLTGFTQETQANSLSVQLQSGMRAIDIRVKHQSNRFQVSDRGCDQGVNFDQVLTDVKSFLTAYPSETVLLHLVEQTSSSGSTRSFEDTYKYYRDNYPDLFWLPTTQDPQLGEVRGKILLIQQFNGLQIHGLLYATFTTLSNKKFGTNWDLYDKWTDVKNFMPAANTAKKSRISFWTGHGGSFPYFVASGKASKGGSSLWTGYSTPGWKNCCRDFPRIDCFWGVCYIYFEGINILGYNFMVSQNFAYVGIVYTDFAGDDLVKRIVGRNTATYAKCTATQSSEGCTLCQLGAGTCLKCNTNMNYVYDSVNKICLAAVGYYLDISYIPVLCSSAMPGCLQCSGGTVCTKCDTIGHYLLDIITNQCIAAPGYYLDLSSIPVACPQIGCSQCLDDTVCTLCNSYTNYIMDPITTTTCMCDNINYFTQAPSVQACICMGGYFLSPLSTCDPMPKCPDITGGCIDCDLVTNVCYTCDAVNHFIPDPTNIFCVCDTFYYYTGTVCDLCNTVDAACDQCASANLCLSCVSNFTLVNGVCQCNYLYYLVDSDTCNLCSVGCLICTGIGSCTTCDAANLFTLVTGYCECIVGRFQQSGVCLLCGAMAGCTDCNNAGCITCEPLFGFHLDIPSATCLCDYGYFINVMQVCQKCMMNGCLECIDQDICLDCNTTQFFLTPAGFCDDICGDGVKFYVDCDDGNLDDGDGCSSICEVETDYTCTGGSTTSADFCSYSGTFTLTLLEAYKDTKKNEVSLQVTIRPVLKELAGIDFSTAINPGFDYASKNVVYDAATGLISFNFEYNSSLNSKTSNQLSVSFDPPTGQPQYFYMKAASFNLPQVTNNNLALKYYDNTIYQLFDIMNTLTKITAFLYIGLFVISFLFVSKLIAIELILVPQIAFAGLIMIQKLQSLLEPLSNIGIVNGYNPLFNDNVSLPPRLKILNYGANFLTNFNICIVLVILPVFAGLALLIVGKITKNKKWTKYAYNSFKQWTFSLLLVIQFQFCISTGIDVLYGQSMAGKVLGGLLIVALIALLFLYFKKPRNFGQFKSYFNPTPLSLSHYIFVIIMRIFLSFNLIILSSNTLCGFVGIGIASAYTIFLIVCRPYLKNVRPILNMLVVLAVLSIESVYKMNFYSPDAQFITSYLPLFIVILLLLLLLANVVFMVLNVMEKYKQKQILEYKKQQDDSIDMEMKRQFDKQLTVINQIQLSLNPKNMGKIKQKENFTKDSNQDQKVKGISQLVEKQKEIKKSLNISITSNPLSKDEEDRLYDEI